jgi:hypothetical protein
VGIAVFAALLVSFVTVDLGRIPGLKAAAERAATKYLNRPLRIGKLEVRPGRGEYVLRDVVIEGYAPADRPHFEVKTIIVRTSYRTLIERQLFIDVALHDWTMRIERWADHHNIPRYQPQGQREKKEKGPLTFRVSARAYSGTFLYEDHTTPWSVLAPNLNFAMDWAAPEKRYAGTANFFGGTVTIQDYLPMSADMKTRFFLEGSKVTLPHIDLKTDGAVSHVTGNLDFSRWPEQSYVVKSDLDFARMKAIFFAKESWVVGGRGQFAGVFNLYKDGRDLSGDFTSDLATVGDLRFPNLQGSLVWLPDRFAVTRAKADLYGGTTQFAYAIEPLGTPTGSTQKFTADFEEVDLRQLEKIVKLRGIELAGRARGRVGMAWPSGKFKHGMSGHGEIIAVPPDGVTLATADFPAPLGYTRLGAPARVPRPKGTPWPALGPLAVGAALDFRFDPEGVTFRESRVATPTTFVSLRGRTTYEGDADFPFHVTSLDWQESDRLLRADDRILQGAAHRRLLHRRRDVRVGRHVGPRLRRCRHRKQVPGSHRRRDHPRRRHHQSERPVRARLSARRPRRRDSREGLHYVLAARRLERRVRSDGLADSRYRRFVRVGAAREVRQRPVRTGAARDREGRSVEGDVRLGARRPHLQWTVGRHHEHRHHEGPGRTQGHGVARVEQHLLVCGDRRAHRGRVAGQLQDRARSADGCHVDRPLQRLGHPGSTVVPVSRRGAGPLRR